MPLIVLLLFYALHRLQHAARSSAMPAGAISAERPTEH
jgi:fumarate reductase subunit D